MSKLPDPLVPAGCSTAGNDWFPLHFQRLRKSKWWRRASDTARARNVMMWGEAYQSTPAGSLPDDDDELAEAAGYGMDIDAFLAVKAEIMAPWTLCSDGRWYHPTVCEVVLDAWAKTSERRKKDAERKAAQRAQTRVVHAESDDVREESGEVPRDIDAVTRDDPENPVGLSTQTEQTVQDSKEDPPKPPLGAFADSLFEKAWLAYPASGRATTNQETSREAWDFEVRTIEPEAILAAILAFAASDVVTGRRAKSPPAFHRWLSGKRYQAWLEPEARAEPDWYGPPGLWDAVVAAKGEKWARSWLAQCAWDAAEGVLIAPRELTEVRLTQDIRCELTAAGVENVRVQGRVAA